MNQFTNEEPSTIHRGTMLVAAWIPSAMGRSASAISATYVSRFVADDRAARS